MRAALHIAALQLRRTARNPGLVLLLLAIPLTIAGIEYAAFGGLAARGKLPPIRVLFLDQDETFLSGAVPRLFTGGPGDIPFEVASIASLDEARAHFRSGAAAAVIRVPEGFQDAILEGREVAISVYRNPIQSISPDVVESVLEIGATVANGLIARAREPLDRIRTLLEGDREPTLDEVAAISVGFYVAQKRLAGFESLDDAEVEVHRPDGAVTAGGLRRPRSTEFFGRIYPGLVLFSLLFVSQALVFRWLRDRSRGLVRRLVTTPTSRSAVQVGGLLYVAAGLWLALAVLGLLGGVIFRIELREPLALVAVGTGFAVFAAACLTLVGALARDERGAQAVSSVFIILLALLGGSFVPLDSLPGVLRGLAQTLPNGAAQRALVAILVEGKSLADTAAATAIVWGWAAVTLAAAFVLERRRLTR